MTTPLVEQQTPFTTNRFTLLCSVLVLLALSVTPLEILEFAIPMVSAGLLLAFFGFALLQGFVRDSGDDALNTDFDYLSDLDRETE